MRLAVIGTFYRRYERAFPLLTRLYVDSSRQPDEAWLMCETVEDAQALYAANEELYEMELLERWPAGLHIIVHPTPKLDGKYLVIPYSNKINWALAHQTCDAIVYLDNNSMPGPDKYRVMLAELEAHENYGAVYCSQNRTGATCEKHLAIDVIPDGYGQVNYTQVMHRPTEDRWPTEMRLANPDLADAHFWSKLARSLGHLYPAGGTAIQDDHFFESHSVSGGLAA